MCKCGCNTCGTNNGPLLTESKVKSLLSEGLQYHIDKKVPLFETVYRIGSDKHLALIKEARKMYSRNVIDLCEEDEALIKTHLGEFALYEGESVPLDLPMLEEEKGEWPKKLTSRYYDEYRFELQKVEPTYKGELGRAKYHVIDIESGELKGTPVFTSIESLEAFADDLIKPQGGTQSSNFGEPLNESYDYDEVAQSEFGMDYDQLGPGEKEWVRDEIDNMSINEAELEEAGFKGKDVSLNKPKRGGSKAYYVYVRDPKTKKVKKVSFGSGGLRAKIKNKEARNAFAARHKCSTKKDRTKAGYWSCNLPKYAKVLGLGANMNTYW